MKALVLTFFALCLTITATHAGQIGVDDLYDATPFSVTVPAIDLSKCKVDDVNDFNHAITLRNGACVEKGFLSSVQTALQSVFSKTASCELWIDPAVWKEKKNSSVPASSCAVTKVVMDNFDLVARGNNSETNDIVLKLNIPSGCAYSKIFCKNNGKIVDQEALATVFRSYPVLSNANQPKQASSNSNIISPPFQMNKGAKAHAKQQGDLGNETNRAH